MHDSICHGHHSVWLLLLLVHTVCKCRAEVSLLSAQVRAAV